MKVILYHQDTCGMCRQVETLLKQAKIDYESCKDIEEMKSRGITQTPILEVDGVKMRGKPMIDWIKGQGK